MDKRTIWAVLVSCVILIGFMAIQNKFFAPKQNGTEVTSETTAEQPAAETPAEPTVLVSKSSKNIPEQTYEITTDKIHVVLTNKGGDLVKYELLEFDDKEEGKVQMVDSVEETNRACSISFGNANDSFENGIINETFNAKKIDDLTYVFEKEFSMKDAEGKTNNFVLQKKYTFKEGEYLFKLDVSVIADENSTLNLHDSAYTLRSAPQIGPHYNSKRDRYENRTLIIFTDKEKAKKNTLKDNQYKVYDKKYLWTGVTGKYFAFLIVPQNSTEMGDILFSKAFDSTQYANAQAMLSRNASTGSFTDSYYVYAGPKVLKVLKTYNNAEKNGWGVTQLKIDDCLNTSGLLSWLEVAMKWIMEVIYKVIPNWGVAIIIMTLLLRFALFPLTKKSSESSLKMQEVQPKVQEIQTKYKDNPEKMNAEMQKLYKENGYNPMMGCLPLLIQFPLLIAMYNLFNNYFEFRGAMFIPGWIPDLSVGDTVYSFKKFSMPLLGTEIRLLPVIYLASQILTGVFTGNDGATTAANQSQKSMKIMMYVMPVMFFFMFYNAPSGLILYWTISNIFSLFQQLFLKSMKKKKDAKKALEAQNKKVPDFVPKKKKRTR
ncbi:MAG: membrane protein insertase YidC [Treponemataceae bacterium]|nr:membrane protein insertase YidC [Treponemataceae bacterium]